MHQEGVFLLARSAILGEIEGLLFTNYLPAGRQANLVRIFE
jgi:hypothetical protein